MEIVLCFCLIILLPKDVFIGFLISRGFSKYEPYIILHRYGKNYFEGQIEIHI